MNFAVAQLAAIAAAFWARVGARPRRGCWLWLGKPGDDGYGRFCWDSATEKAHRAAWVLANGPIPDGLCVLHECDVRACVRPDHLFLGTRGDNARDMASKGRQWLQRNPQALAGDRHWKRRRPDLIKLAVVEPCARCSYAAKPYRRREGRCQACHSYLRRNGVERPAHLFGNHDRSAR